MKNRKGNNGNEQMSFEDQFQLKTKKGYNFDEVASALQKEIRRGKEKEAMYWCLEMFDSGYIGYLFRRIPVIACEDISLGDNEVVRTVMEVCTYGLYMFDNKKRVDSAILGYIIILLCRAKKNREGDEFVNIIMDYRKKNRIEVPDYAVDMHTVRGKELGRGADFFWDEGSKLSNSVPNVKWNYKKQKSQ